MPLSIIRSDITKIQCDAIVNAANYTLLGGGGVDGAIHAAAGKKLVAECKMLGGCAVGQAKLTGGYKLPAKYVIHTVGPVWQGGSFNEDRLLYDCYTNSLLLAKEFNCFTVAFPLISSGAYGYPKDRALKIAIDAISSFLLENDMDVTLVIYDKNSFRVSEKLIKDITQYIDDKYVEAHFVGRESTILMPSAPAEADVCAEELPFEDDIGLQPTAAYPKRTAPEPSATRFSANATASLNDMLTNIDESFTEMLLRKIDESGMTDSQCYKKANIDRKLFSKIRSDLHYKPSKTTAIAFSIALGLDLNETKSMLEKAGYALSHSNKFDIIIECFIENKNYNVFEINEVLFQFDQSLLGN